MTDFFENLGATIANLGTWAYAFIALFTLAETVIGIGQFLPGSVFLAFVGFLCYMQVLDLGPTLLVVVLAHYAGEWVNYAIGRRRGRGLFKEEALVLKTALLQAVERQLHRWGPIYFVLCQFSGVLRPVLSFLAGATRYPRLRFALWMVPACALWGGVHLGLGFVLGASWRQAASYIEDFSLLVLVGTVCVGLAVWAMRTVSALGSHVARLVERAGRRARESRFYLEARRRNPRVFHFLERRLSSTDPWGWQATIRLAAGAMGLIAACAVGWYATSSHRAAYFDAALANLLAQLRTPFAASLLAALTDFGQPRRLVLAGIVLGVVCALAGRRRSAVLFLSAPALGVTLAYGLKLFFRRMRPLDVAAVAADGFSFPSTHAATACAFFLATIVWLWRSTEDRKLRTASTIVPATSILLIGYSRLYLGAHYLTDVLGGWFVGTAATMWAALLSTNLSWKECRWSFLPSLGLVGAAFAFLGFSAALFPASHVREPTATLQDCPPAVHTTSLDEALPQLARFATRLTGSRSLAINVIVTGGADKLVAALQKEGWRLVPPQAFYTRDLQAPIFPAFVEARPAWFTLEQRNGTQRRVLRLWCSKIEIGGRRLWLGCLIRERLKESFLGIQVFSVDPDIDLVVQEWCQSTKVCQCQFRNDFRARGLYRIHHQFFSHGLVAVLDASSCASPNANDNRQTGSE